MSVERTFQIHIPCDRIPVPMWEASVLLLLWESTSIHFICFWVRDHHRRLPRNQKVAAVAALLRFLSAWFCHAPKSQITSQRMRHNGIVCTGIPPVPLCNRLILFLVTSALEISHVETPRAHEYKIVSFSFNTRTSAERRPKFHFWICFVTISHPGATIKR